MPKLYRKILDLRNMYLIKNSGYFDKDYYKREYPEVKGNLLKHYYYKGYKLGNNPSEKFSNNYYLNHNVDIRNCGINPLLHYVVSGKKEGREIRKYLGMTIPDLYYHLNGINYNCNVYLKKEEKERITFFLENNLTKDNIGIIKDLIELCKKEKKQFRIIYKNIKIDDLHSEFKKQKIEIFSDLSFLKWNEKYLLEINLNEKIICGNFSVLCMLINTRMILNPIYYHITNDSKLSEKEKMFLSFWIQNKMVICIGNQKLNQYQLKIENNLNTISKENYNLCFDFADISVHMLQMYNEFFLNSYYLQNFKFYYRSECIQKNICFDNGIPIHSSINLDDMDVVIRFSYKNNGLSDNSSCINIYFEKTNQFIETIELKKIFLENKRNSKKEFDIELEQILKKIGIGDKHV